MGIDRRAPEQYHDILAGSVAPILCGEHRVLRVEREVTGSGRGKMAEEGRVYVCEICGQEVKVLVSGIGTLVCCDQPMTLKEEEGPKR